MYHRFFASGFFIRLPNYKPHIPPSQTLNSHFRAHGYFTCGAGKIYHGGGGRREEWDDYGARTRPESKGAHERGGVGKLAWAKLKGGDDSLGDYHTVSYAIDRLAEPHAEKPFFLACGIFRPHLPWNVPEKYFDLHPLDQIELPPHLPDDLDDIPPAGVKTARPTGDHAAVLEAKQWKPLVQAYLASVSYADAQLGRLLDALEESSHKHNTVIVLWGDHGWHLGEKSHWRKFALWEEATLAPLIWVAPGTTPEGKLCHRPVDFMAVYPTLCDLAGLPVPDHAEGHTITPLLKDPDAAWPHPALTTHGRHRHAVRTERYRYIRYENGDEELYDHDTDPYEHTNLATRPEHAALKEQLAAHFPKTNAPEVPRSK